MKGINRNFMKPLHCEILQPDGIRMLPSGSPATHSHPRKLRTWAFRGVEGGGRRAEGGKSVTQPLTHMTRCDLKRRMHHWTPEQWRLVNHASLAANRWAVVVSKGTVLCQV